VYGPTGVPMPHHYYPQVNQQLPFLATLDLPDLSRLTNDPIFHSLVWPAIPAKLPSDIPKFDEKFWRRPKQPCDDFPFVVFIELPHGRFYTFVSFPTNAYEFCSKVVY
jgi:hypothetical protein